MSSPLDQSDSEDEFDIRFTSGILEILHDRDPHELWTGMYKDRESQRCDRSRI